jgi:predicted ATPase
MIFEDLHWIDPTSLEALGRIVNRSKTLPALLIVTFRPEFNAPWVGQPHVTSLTLNRLGEREAAAIIAHIVGNKGLLAADVILGIVERTDGIPLFVEEMTKAVLEAESEVAAQRTVAAVPSPPLALPASLHASLMARLDRLGAPKEVAQIAAAIGREFSYALLAAVIGKPEEELRSGLDRLINAGLLFQQGSPPHATYLFKHALVQDAAYSTLLREPRRELQARIADVLESQFTEIAESQPELLARHCTEAGLIEKAAVLWGKAGQRSLERSALVEVAEQLTRALDQIATVPSTAALRREQINLQVALITPLLHVKGYAAPETKMAAERARQLIERAEALGEPPENPLLLFSVLYSAWTASYAAFNGDVMCNLAAQFLSLAEKQRATAPLVIAHRITGISLTCTGNIAQGRAHFDRGLLLHDPIEHHSLAKHFSVDAQVSNLSWRSKALWFLGYPDRALADAEHVLRLARETGQAATLMYGMFNTAFTHIHCGNYAEANAQIDKITTLAGKTGGLFWNSFGRMSRGVICSLTGKASEAVQIITGGITTWRSIGSTVRVPWYLSYLAKAHAELKEFEDAWCCIGKALNEMKTSKERWCEAEVHRIAGYIALQSPKSNLLKAESHFDRALTIAREQQAKSWELRAATALARLWRDQGKRQQAHDLLAPVYGWFTEGFDTLDLKEAKALLDELA